MDSTDGESRDTTATTAAISSGNEIGYWTKTRTENEDKPRTPQQHPLARDRASRLNARLSLGAGSCMASEALARAVRTAVNPRPLVSPEGPGTDADVELWRERLPHVQGRHDFTVDLARYEGQAVEFELRVTSAGRRPPPAGIELIGLP